jgi:hypothetical protein
MTNHTNPQRRILAVVFTASAVVAGCGSSTATSEPSTTKPTTAATAVSTTTAVATTPAATTPSTTAAPTGPFRSPLYGYVVTSLDWTARPATVAWDGTGSPGSADALVDVLRGPERQQVYAFGGPTTVTLDEFVAASRAANAAERSCPEVPAATRRITMAGEPAIVDEVDCGVFALSATVIHAGRVYAFFTFDQPGKEAEMRAWFDSLLQAVAFDA